MALVTVATIALCGCGSGGGGAKKPLAAAPAKITVTSSAFAANAAIPKAFTCDGANHAPPLAWRGLPSRAAEVAISVDDPDAPGGDFVHWTAYGIAPGASRWPASGALEGRNSFGKTGYSGPCPPAGNPAHRYRFTVYALSRRVKLARGASPDQFRAAVTPAAIAQGTLGGRYSR